MKNITTFGELMLRLTPSLSAGKIITAGSFNIDYAGAETNVASSLARFGHHVNFVSKLPGNPLGDAAIHALNSHGIDTQGVLRGGERIGTYFIELGASIRPSRVVYDRANSAISAINPDEFDWPSLLEGQQWLHLSGITLALSEQCLEETVKAAHIAHDMGVKVSFDLNFRRTLWRDAKVARMAFEKVLAFTDLVHGNTGVLKDVFDFDFAGKTPFDATINAVKQTQKHFNVPYVAFTVRDHHSASSNTLAGVFGVDNDLVHSETYDVDILDRFGTGDAFAAAILHGLSQRWTHQKTVDFASAAFALKHTIHGDQHTSSEAEIVDIMQGHTSGHVIR